MPQLVYDDISENIVEVMRDGGYYMGGYCREWCAAFAQQGAHVKPVALGMKGGCPVPDIAVFGKIKVFRSGAPS